MAGEAKKLAFGYRRYPDGVAAVWGARLIAPNDLLHDRQDLVYEDVDAKRELVEWLNGANSNGALSEALFRLGRHGTDSTGIPALKQEDREFVVFEDATGRIVGNTQASHGYVYVAGWLHKHAPLVRTGPDTEPQVDGMQRLRETPTDDVFRSQEA